MSVKLLETVSYKGEEYTAVDLGEPGRCRGCVWHNQRNCTRQTSALKTFLCTRQTSAIKTFLCTAQHRADLTGVIWMRAHDALIARVKGTV